MEPLNMKDIAIIDAFPSYSYPKTVLEVGCGDGKLDYHLATMGYKAYATDIKEWPSWKQLEKTSIYTEKTLFFSKADIFDLSSFPVKSASVVIASQVLEHLPGWRTALVHLIALAGVRLIITVPYKRSFSSPEHINFWIDQPTSLFPEYKGISEFIKLCHPYSTTISKIRTKPEDVPMNQYAYLIVVDKRQGFNE